MVEGWLVGWLVGCYTSRAAGPRGRVIARVQTQLNSLKSTTQPPAQCSITQTHSHTHTSHSQVTPSSQPASCKGIATNRAPAPIIMHKVNQLNSHSTFATKQLSTPPSINQLCVGVWWVCKATPRRIAPHPHTPRAPLLLQVHARPPTHAALTACLPLSHHSSSSSSELGLGVLGGCLEVEGSAGGLRREPGSMAARYASIPFTASSILRRLARRS